MSMVIRHDAITLLAGADAEAFERFMTSALLPHLAERFMGPTRVSKADLSAQSLLQDAKSPRKYLLVTHWRGAPASVRGSQFENARMNTVATTGQLLEQLAGFGTRSAEKVFSELASSVVPTNT